MQVNAQERRHVQRYRTKERALLSTGPGKENLFHLLDISENGAGFRYLSKENRTKGLRQVDLYFQDTLWLKDVKVSLVEDVPMLSGMIPFRRCGLRFVELNDQQSAVLLSYVKKTAVGDFR